MPDLTAAQAVLAAAMPEAELEDNVAALCRVYAARGLRRYHTLRPRGSAPGWPDDVIGGPGGVIFRELKKEKGKPTADQVAWLDTLTAAGLDADLWRPTDWFTGRIEAEIRRVAGR